jgi:hypothetical protein
VIGAIVGGVLVSWKFDREIARCKQLDMEEARGRGAAAEEGGGVEVGDISVDKRGAEAEEARRTSLDDLANPAQVGDAESMRRHLTPPDGHAAKMRAFR